MPNLTAAGRDGSKDPLFILYTPVPPDNPGCRSYPGRLSAVCVDDPAARFDVREDDTYWCTADIGWVTGLVIVYGPLCNGHSSILFGVPNYRTSAGSGQSSKNIMSTISYCTDSDPFHRQRRSRGSICMIFLRCAFWDRSVNRSIEAWWWYYNRSEPVIPISDTCARPAIDPRHACATIQTASHIRSLRPASRINGKKRLTVCSVLKKRPASPRFLGDKEAI